MRKFIILFTFLFTATNIWAQDQSYNVRRIEIEPSFGIGRGIAFALEARTNISAYWDVGVRGGWSDHGATASVFSDYNFARPNKNFLFFVGAGVGLGEHEKSNHTDGSSRITNQFIFMPRAGIELFQHLRLTLNVSTYNFSAAYPIVSLGVVFGGGRK